MSNLFEKLINQELLLANFELEKLAARADSRSNDDVSPKDPRLKSTCPPVENRHGAAANPNEEDQYKSSNTLSTSSTLSSKNIQGYTIPKRKLDNMFQDVALSSREFINDVLPPIIQSYRFPQSESHITITSAKLVHNNQLYAKFLERKRSMIMEGRNEKELMELYAFLSVGNENLAKKICTEGVRTGNVTISSLGQARLGVCLQKHADILKPRDPESGSSTFVILFKIIKGRTKQTSEYSSSLEPTPNYDCHVSKYLASDAVGLDMKHLYSSTQLYLYEYDDDKVVERPRHIYPYAILTFAYKEKDPSMTHTGSNKTRNPQVRTVLPKGIKVWSGQLYNKLNYISDVNLISFSLFHKPLCIGSKITISQTMSIPKMRLKYFSKLSRISLRRECHVGSQFLLCCQLQADSSSLIFRQLIKYLVNANQVAIWNCGRRVEALLIPSCLSSAALGFPALPTPECAMHCLFISPYSLAQRLDLERERVYKRNLHMGRIDPTFHQGSDENFEAGFILPIPTDSLLKPNVLVGIFEQQAVLQKAIDSYSTVAQTEINENESELNIVNSSTSAFTPSNSDSNKESVSTRGILKTCSSDSVNSLTLDKPLIQRQSSLNEISASHNPSPSLTPVEEEIISRPVMISHESSKSNKSIEKTTTSFAKDRRSQSRDDRKRIRAAIQNQKAPPGIPNILLEGLGSHSAEYLSDSDNAAYSPSQFTPVSDLVSHSGEKHSSKQRRHSTAENIQERSKERKSSSEQPAPAEADKLTEAIMNVCSAFGLSKPPNPEPHLSKPLNPEPHVKKPLNPEPHVNKPLNPEPHVSKPLNPEPHVNKPLHPEPPNQVKSQPLPNQEAIPPKPSSANVQNLFNIIHKDPRLARLKNLVPTSPSFKSSSAKTNPAKKTDSISTSAKDRTPQIATDKSSRLKDIEPSTETHSRLIPSAENSNGVISSSLPKETSSILKAQSQEKSKSITESPVKQVPVLEKITEPSSIKKNKGLASNTVNKNPPDKTQIRSTVEAETDKEKVENISTTSIKESEAPTLLSCLQTIIDALNTTTGKKIECSEILKTLSGTAKLQLEDVSHGKATASNNLATSHKEQDKTSTSSPQKIESLTKQQEQNESKLSSSSQRQSEQSISDNSQKPQERSYDTSKETSANAKDVTNSASPHMVKVIPLESCTSLNLDDPRLRKLSQEIEETDLDILSDQKTNDSSLSSTNLSQESQKAQNSANASKTDLTIHEALVNFHVEENKLLGSSETVEDPINEKLDFVGTIDIKQISLKPIKYASNIEKFEKGKSKGDGGSGALCNQLIKDMEFEMRAEAMSRIWNKVKDFNNSSEVKEVISSTLSINDENGGKLLFDFDSYQTTKDLPKKDKIPFNEKDLNVLTEKSPPEIEIIKSPSKSEKQPSSYKSSKETKVKKKSGRRSHYDYLVYEEDFEKPSKRRKYRYDDDLLSEEYEDINYGFQVTDINTMEEIENFFLELSSISSFYDDRILSKSFQKENGFTAVRKTFLESSSLHIPEDNLIANLVKRECQKFDVEITNLLKDIRGEDTRPSQNVIFKETTDKKMEVDNLRKDDIAENKEKQDAVISNMLYFYDSLSQLLLNYGIHEEKSNVLENRLVWNSVIHHDKNLSQHCTSNKNLEKKLESLKLELNSEMDRLIAECQNKINNCIKPDSLDKRDQEMSEEEAAVGILPEVSPTADAFETFTPTPFSTMEAFSKMNLKHQSLLERDSNNALQLKKQPNSITICIKQNEQNIRNSRNSERKSSVTEEPAVEAIKEPASEIVMLVESKEPPSLDLACIPLPEECSKDKIETSLSQITGGNSEGTSAEFSTLNFAAAFASSGIIKESSGFAQSESKVSRKLPKESANFLNSNSELYDPSVPSKSSDLRVVKRKLRKRRRAPKNLLSLSNKLRQMLPSRVQPKDAYLTYRQNLLKYVRLSEKQTHENPYGKTPAKRKKNVSKKGKRTLLGKRYLHLENALVHLIEFVRSDSSNLHSRVSLSTPLNLLLEKLSPSISTLMKYKSVTLRRASKRKLRDSVEEKECSSSTVISTTEYSLTGQATSTGSDVLQDSVTTVENIVSQAKNIPSDKHQSDMNLNQEPFLNSDSSCIPTAMDVVCDPLPVVGVQCDPSAMGVVCNPPVVCNPSAMGMVTNMPPLGMVTNPPPMGIVPDPSAMGMVTDPVPIGIPPDPSVLGMVNDPAAMGVVCDPSSVNMMNDPTIMGTIPEAYPINSNVSNYVSYPLPQRTEDQMPSGQLQYPPAMVTNDFCINQNVPCPDTNFITEEEINATLFGHTGWFLVFGQHAAFCAEAQSYLESQGHRLFDLKNFDALHRINKGEELWVFIHMSGLAVLHQLPGLYHIKYLPNCHLMAFEHPQQLPNRNCTGLMESGGIIVPDLDLLLNITPGVLTRLLNLLERNQERNQPWIFLMHSHIMKHLELKASRSSIHDGPTKVVSAILNLLNVYQEKGIVHIMFPHACDSREMPNPHLACLQNLQERHAFTHRYVILLSRLAASSDDIDHFISSGISVFDTFSLMKKHFSFNNSGML